MTVDNLPHSIGKIEAVRRMAGEAAHSGPAGKADSVPHGIVSGPAVPPAAPPRTAPSWPRIFPGL
jgi:hypothetical protein